MRNILFIAVVCCLFFASCKHKLTEEEIAAHTDSIVNVINSNGVGIPVKDLLTLPDVKWAVFTVPGLAAPDTLIFAAIVGDKVCLTNIRGDKSSWKNLTDSTVTVSSLKYAYINKNNIESTASVVEVKTGSVNDVAQDYANRVKVYKKQIKDFVVSFYSSYASEFNEEDVDLSQSYTESLLHKIKKYKNFLSKSAYNKIKTGREGMHDFCPEGIYPKQGVVRILPTSINIISIKGGNVQYDMDFLAIHSGTYNEICRCTGDFSMCIIQEDGCLCIDDITAPGWSISKGMDDFDDVMGE